MTASSVAIERTPEISAWPRYPTVYEIDTWVWLSSLAAKHGKEIDLRSVPAAEWDAIGAHRFDAVWLMGVWERSPAGIAIASQNESLLKDFRRAIPDFCLEDIVGSPYCVRNYVADERIGGLEGLAIARRELSMRGMKLVLDFVPNHVAPDHPWVAAHPEYFVRGSAADLSNDPSSYIQVGNTIFACGRDPYFPAWPDVLQLNAFDPGLRSAVIETVSVIAEQCDGIRCDMAMLLLNSIFERTWTYRTGPRPTTEYWRDVISTIRHQYPNFLFIAEAYWEMEWELQQQGFDFCYDKKLYDRLEHSDAESIRLHLCADSAFQDKLIRFIENHDEPRAAATFNSSKQQAAAVTIATIPGAKLFHEGQFSGRKVKVPVFLGRRPDENADEHLESFYAKLTRVVSNEIFHEGEWRLCDRSGWPGNTTFQNLVAWSWQSDYERYLIVVNLGDGTSQGRVRVPWRDAGAKHWRMTDVLSGVTYERDGDEMLAPGLYVELGSCAYHFFQCLEAK